jgi:hypothetical protein
MAQWSRATGASAGNARNQETLMALKKEYYDLLKWCPAWIVPRILERLEKLPDRPEVLFEAEVDFGASNILFVCRRGDA